MIIREILFRGKRLGDGKWVEGVAFPHDNNGEVTILRQHPMDGSLMGNEVDPETVGQYTGLKDKNGRKIFEGDIISFHQFLFDGSEYEKEILVSIEYMDDTMCFGLNLLEAEEEKNIWVMIPIAVIKLLCLLMTFMDHTKKVVKLSETSLTTRRKKNEQSNFNRQAYSQPRTQNNKCRNKRGDFFVSGQTHV